MTGMRANSLLVEAGAWSANLIPVMRRHWIIAGGKLLLAGSLCAWTGCAAPSMPRMSMPSFNTAWMPKFGGNKEKDEAPPKVRLAWAALQERDGNLVAARTSYQMVLDQDPKSLDALLGLARLDYLANRPDEAEHGFKRAVALAPESPEPLDAIGQFYAEQQRWPEAISALNGAVERGPNEKAYRYHLAVALAKSGDVAESLPHFNQSVGIAEAHYNVGLILYEKGESAAAEEQFLQAVIKNPQLEQAQTWLDEIRREGEAKQVLSQAPGTRAIPAPPQVPRDSAPILPNTPQIRPNSPQITSNPHQSPLQPAGTTAAPQSGNTPIPAWLPNPQTATATSLVSPPPAQPAQPIAAPIIAPGAAPRPAESAGIPAYYPAQPPAAADQPHGGVTPQQLEQLRNQRNANPATPAYR